MCRIKILFRPGINIPPEWSDHKNTALKVTGVNTPKMHLRTHLRSDYSGHIWRSSGTNVGTVLVNANASWATLRGCLLSLDCGEVRHDHRSSQETRSGCILTPGVNCRTWSCPLVIGSLRMDVNTSSQQDFAASAARMQIATGWITLPFQSSKAKPAGTPNVKRPSVFGLSVLG